MLETESFIQVALHRDKLEERNRRVFTFRFILALVYACCIVSGESVVHTYK